MKMTSQNRWRHDERQPRTPQAAMKVANIPCRSLPLLPPITQNVKLSHPANPLQLRLRAGSPSATKLKNGKNGNVHRASQHYYPSPHPRPVQRTYRLVLRGWQLRGASARWPCAGTSVPRSSEYHLHAHMPRAPRKLIHPAQERNRIPAAEPPLYLVYSLLPKTRGAIVDRVADLASQRKGTRYGRPTGRQSRRQTLVVPAPRHPVHRAALGALLQLHPAGAGGHPLLLLVSVPLGDHRRGPHCRGLLRHQVTRRPTTTLGPRGIGSSHAALPPARNLLRISQPRSRP